jgi:hypothetical protein
MRVGLDTISAVFRVVRVELMELPDARESRHVEGATGLVTTYQSATLPSGLRARSQSSKDDGEKLIVEGSLPTLANGTNFRPLELTDFRGVMRDLVVPELRQFSEGLEGDNWLHSRIDTVTDLDCEEVYMSGLLKGLEAVPIRKGNTRTLHRSTLERPETLMVRNGSGAVRGYDKVLESALRGVPIPKMESGKLRVEGQSRREWLKNAGARTGLDVETFPENVVGLHAKRIRWAGFDREVVMEVTALEELDAYCQRNGHTQRVSDAVFGYLMRTVHGLPQQASKEAMAKYRRIAREAGVQPADLKLPMMSQVSYRLDFEQEKVVRRVA